MDSRSLESGSRFLASALHEIRTPIQTIIGTLELLSETELSEEQKEYIHQLDFSANVLLQLANNVLDFSKIRSGEVKLENIPFDIVSLCEKVVDLICIDAFAKSVDVITEIDWTLPTSFIGDPTRIQQILLNLVKNAVKFTPEGFIQIKVYRRDAFLFFEVNDTGIGIPEEKREVIFKEFVQVDESTTRKFGGTGLGLAICKNLVDLLGGKIGVEQNEYGGSKFWFTVPFKEDESKKSLPSFTPLLKGKNVSALIILGCKKCQEYTAESLHKKCSLMGFSKITVCTNISDGEKCLLEAEKQNEPYTICFLSFGASQEMNIPSACTSTTFCSVLPESKSIRINNPRITERLCKPFKRESFIHLCKKICGEDKTSGSQIKTQNQIEESASGLHVLVAEDHPMNRLLLKSMLEKLGAIVHLAENGEEAVSTALAEKNINIIFMDIQMPVKNGIDATAELRSKNYNGIIIACTANTDKADYDAYMEIGINDILPKPFKRDDVNRLLKKWENILLSPDVEKLLSWKRITNEANSLWNIEDFLDTTGNDKKLALTLVKDYLVQTEKHLVTLQEELSKSDCDFELLERLAHLLMGSSSAISATGLFEQAKLMEDAARKKNKSLTEAHRVSFFIDFVHFQKLTEIWETML